MLLIPPSGGNFRPDAYNLLCIETIDQLGNEMGFKFATLISENHVLARGIICASDVISGVIVWQVGLDVCVKFGESC